LISEGGEAGHDRLVGTAQDDDRRIAEQIQMVALWQAGSRVVVYRWLPSVYWKRWLLLNNIVPALFKHVVVNSRLSLGELP
jgi:hypothetical protein